MICHLLENHTDDVLGVIGANLESLNEYLNPMLSCVQHSPVVRYTPSVIGHPSSVDRRPSTVSHQPSFINHNDHTRALPTTRPSQVPPAIPHHAPPSTYPSSYPLLPLLLPQAETLVKLVSCPTMTPKVRWALYTSLSARKFLLLLAERATGTDPLATEAERTPAHCSACAEVFTEVTDSLAVDPHGGELLLQPIGHCPELLDGLLASVCGTRQADGTIRHRPYRQRLDAAQVLQRLVAKATHDELPAASPMGDMSSFAAMGMAPEMVSASATVRVRA